MLFVHLFPHWQHENQPMQRQIPVEYRLKIQHMLLFFSVSFDTVISWLDNENNKELSLFF